MQGLCGRREHSDHRALKNTKSKATLGQNKAGKVGKGQITLGLTDSVKYGF